MKRVLFIGSSGGHITEILSLEKLFDKYEYLLVTEETKTTTYLSEKYNMEYLVYGPNANMLKYVYNILVNIFRCIKIVLKFKPETVVTTGAQVGGFMLVIAKILCKSKVIYIESIAKTSELSKTGKNMYKFVDKFYVQWENMAKIYDKAEYLGRLM